MNSRGEIFFWVGARFVLGALFLWAFFDKVFGWGFATPAAQAWLRGGSPTSGFLKFGVTGPLAPFFHMLAGRGWVDILFMAGLFLIGSALICGVGLKIAGWSGAVLSVLMWSALLLPKNNPLIDEHIVYVLIFIGLALSGYEFGAYWGLGKWWSQTALVKKYPFLR